MRVLALFFMSLFVFVAQASSIYPGQTTDITYEPTTGEYGPSWTTDNPTLHLTSVGFLCHVTAQAYFQGTATVTCTYKDRVGSSIYTRTRKWTFTCIDTKISISPTSKNIKVGESFQLSWSFSNATYINPSIQFTGYDSNVLTVSNSGLVTAKSEGTTKIYVKSNIGTNSVVCSVSVNSSFGGTNEATSDYDNWDSSNTKVVTLEQPGTLSDFISSSEKYSITDLTVVGPLNGYDLRLLRDMCGLDENNSPTDGKLVILDLKDAVFVSGGPWYVKAYGSYKYTSDTPFMPSYSFAWMSKLKKIRFPKYCTELTNSSLLQCYSLELMSIPPGVTTLDIQSLEGVMLHSLPMSVLTLPSSMKNFDASIYKCDNLTDIYCYALVPPSIKYPNDFEDQTNITNGTLYVPKGSAESYWKADGWRAFKNIKETLDVFNTLSIYVGEYGKVNYKNVEIKQKYGISYTGYQAFEIPSDEEVVVEIIPEPGYSISNIFIDDQPQDIPVDGMLKLGKLTNHTILNVSFEDETASIDDIFDEDEISAIDVFNLQGNIIKKNIAKDEINALPSGMYIVKNGSNSYKILKR